MKLHILKQSFRRVLAAVTIMTLGVAGAAGYDLEFVNGVAEPGGGACTLNLNDRCRFSNVVIGAGTGPANPFQRDIVVTVSKLTTATLGAPFDNAAPTLTTPPVPVATPTQFFAPSVQPPQGAANANAIGWAEFTFDFVTPGGPAPAAGAGTATLPGNVWVSSFDTDSDGGTLREFVEFVGLSATDTALAAPTNLSLGTAVDGGVQYQSGAASGANIVTDPAFKASAVYTNPASFKLVYGARTGASGSTAGPRLTAFDFLRPDAILLRPLVDAYKSVKLTDTDSNGAATSGDTLTYTVTYVNTGNAAVTGFQITDALPAGVTAAAGAQTVRLNGTVTAGARNAAYTGTGANTNLLAAGQTLPVNGTVSVDIPVTVGTVATDNTILSNQTTSSGNYVNAAGATVTQPSTSSDNVDNTTAFQPTVATAAGFGTVPAGSVAQTQAATTDPTTVTLRRLPGIVGSVYEDFNYGGGAGRAFSAVSGMALRPGVRIELFNSAGTFVAAAFTDASGAYSFPGRAAGNYTVRVVNSFVTSSRGGGCAAAANATTPPAGCTQLPVQTFVNADVNRVGGEVPSGVDPVLSTTTLPAGAESLASVTVGGVGSADVSGVDFGFNFDTVVNKNASGQGSLSQFITNASALSNAGLAQNGSRQDFGTVQALPAGVETSIFMASGGTAVPGLRAGLPSQLSAGVLLLDQSGVSLPSVTGANAAITSIDGTTQTVNVGNTNSGLLGTGGTVGYISTATLGQVQRPEVEIVGASTRAYGLDLQSASDQVRGVAIRGFGSTANNPNSANIHIGAVSGSVIEQNFAGFAASATTLCGATTTVASGAGDNLRSDSGTNGVVRGNLIACAAGKGFGVETASTNWLIENNEIRGNGIGNPTLDGIDLENAGTANNTVRGNLITANGGVGVDGYQGGGSNLIERNTVTGNGVAQSSVPGETPGMRIYSSNNTIQNNVIALNYGAGVMVTGAVGGNRISQNSIYDNGTVASAGGGAGTVTAASGQIGIDLLGAAEDVSKGVSPYVTKNDAGDADTGGNGLLNFPVFSGAFLNPSGTTLTLSGFARPGSLIELFIAAADGSNFGEGKTYLTTVQEGSTADLDNGTGTYNTSAGTDTTNRFRFSLALSSLPGVGIGTVLTATATCLSTNGCTDAPTGSTSEFSFNVPATGTPLLNLVKQERNCGPVASGALCTGTFTTAVNVKPADVIEYCIDYTNAGNAAASGIVLTDLVPSNTTADLNGYGTGKGVSVTTGGTTTLYTSAADGDAGSLTAVQLSLSVPSLATSGTGRVCFRATVR